MNETHHDLSTVKSLENEKTRSGYTQQVLISK